MGLGNLLRSAADAADRAKEATTTAYESAVDAAKDKAAALRGTADNEFEVYDSAVTAVGDAIADSGQMNSDIMAILQSIRKGNPYG